MTKISLNLTELLISVHPKHLGPYQLHSGISFCIVGKLEIDYESSTSAVPINSEALRSVPHVQSHHFQFDSHSQCEGRKRREAVIFVLFKTIDQADYFDAKMILGAPNVRRSHG